MASLPKTLGRFFWYFLRQQWLWIITIQILCFCWAFDQITIPYVIKALIDNITNMVNDRAQVWQVITSPLLLGASVWILIEISYRLYGLMIANIFPKIEAAVRLSMFDYVQHHAPGFFADHMAGALANKISDMTLNMSNALQMIITTFIPGVFAMFVTVSLFVHVQTSIAWILLAWIVFHLSVCAFSAKRCDDLALIHSEARSVLVGKMVDSFSNIANVILFARYRHEYNYLKRYQLDERAKNWRVSFFIEKIKIILGAATILVPGVAVTYSAIHAWQYHLISLGSLVFIMNTTRNILAVVWLVGLLMPPLFRQIGICRQGLTVIQAPHQIIDAADSEPLHITNGEIVFKNVDFHYGKYHLFQNKTVTIAAGKKIGLVGFSGSGKSTFVNLILRMFDLSSGQILIDGQDIAKVTQASLRSQIAMIPQDSSLFHRSVIENIRYGRPTATDAEVIEAAKQAHCHEFITQLPEGYQTLVGERGAKISGGQRQRIAIARAVLKNAPILILDEATSALDSVTEKYIQDSLDMLMQDRTSLVIAHRLATLANMDLIFVFHQGRIVEVGTHHELLTLNGHYAQLWRMQAGGFLPEKPLQQAA